LTGKISPLYPPEAKAAGVQGTVALKATIGKDGHVTNLSVVSGPAMLQQSAMDAVKQWVYRPYLVNGEPVEVDTTLSVTYTLGDKAHDK
jgi:protein TonB